MIGQTVSHYKILEKIGEGGMGVVYKASDLKLDRLVAIKFLPPHLSSDENAKKRFIHEAKAASALDHPHISNIHDIDETPDGRLFIVMACYEGQTLKQKIEAESPSIDESIEIVIQIASGLVKAHESGIIHRDIKPANVLLTKDGQAKIVDFGLAKLTGETRVTQTGMTVGTVAYMSPEQALGEEVDERSDIFSLGIVLYELVTGQQPFKGDHDAAVLYGITQNDPEPMNKFRSNIPDELHQIVDRALKKNKTERYQSVLELKGDLEKLKGFAGSGKSRHMRDGLIKTRYKGGRRRIYTGIGIIIVLWIIGGAYLLSKIKSGDLQTKPKEATPSETIESHQMTLKQVTFSEGVEEYPAFSSDGLQLAYCAEVNGYRHLFIKVLETGEETQLTEGNVDNIQPAWSPDGDEIVFVRSHQAIGKLEPGDVFGTYWDGDIWLLDLASRKESVIIEKAYNPSYSSDGKYIAFDASWAGPRRIWIADHRGRNPLQISSDSSEVVAHILPRWSPDDSKIVFQNNSWTNFDIKIVEVQSHIMKSVTNDRFWDLNPVWSRSGDAVYFSSYRGGGLNVWTIPVSEDGSPSGLPQQITTGAGQDVQLAVSPDGKHIAMSILRQNADIWKIPVSPRTGMVTGEPEQVIATTREDSRGAWSPDNKKIAFNSDRSGNMNIWVYSFDDGLERQVTRGPGGDFQPNWSPDETRLAFFSSRSGNPDIYVVEIATGDLKQLTKGGALDINPFFSPDGKTIAYQSDYDGRKELWAMNADGTEQRQLTNISVGGHFLLWSRDGQNIIFSSGFGGKTRTWQVPLEGGDPTLFGNVKGGAHLSFSPDRNMIMDVIGHKTMWVSPLIEGEPQQVFNFEDPDIRIDYPVWSPDGRWILFDRFEPLGGDIWFIES